MNILQKAIHVTVGHHCYHLTDIPVPPKKHGPFESVVISENPPPYPVRPLVVHYQRCCQCGRLE